MKSEITITKPKFTQCVGKHLFKWEDLGISIEISRIKDDSHCELIAYHDNGIGRQYLLPPTSTNLISSRDISGLSKKLAEKTPEQLTDKHWTSIMGMVAAMSITAIREGSPVIMLDEKFGRVRPEYLISPLFIKNAVNIIFGDRGSGKTTMILLISLLLGLPWTDNPLKLIIPKGEKHNVLYLDWENSENIIGWQKSCICRGMKIADMKLAYRHCDRPLIDDLPQVQAKIDETGADVIIIDSLGMAVGDDLNLTKPAFTFFSALRQLPVTPIVLAHTSKDRENKNKSVYGNGFYENLARSIWEANKIQDPGSNELNFSLFQRKSPPFSGTHEPLGYIFTFGIDSTSFSVGEPAGDKRDGDDVKPSEVVLSIIEDSDEPLSPQDIYEKTDPKIPQNNIRQILSRLKKGNKIKVYPDGKYVKN